MAGRRPEVEGVELNLAPIMNIVMILIPLMLVTASFVSVSVLNVTSPRSAQSMTPEEENTEEDQIPVPRVLVAVTENGFTVTDMRQSPAFAESQLGMPLGECPPTSAEGGVPVTVCNLPHRASSPELIRRLNYRGLYNRLVEVKNFSAWSGQWDNDNIIINIVAEREIPFEVVVRVMDVSRFLLENDSYGDEELFASSEYRVEGEGQLVVLFPNPVLLLPRAAAE